jgi:hypothetical protein
MSLAKLHITNKSRKEWTCGKCREIIPVGSKVIRFTVGFRGRPQERCSKSECFPKPSDRESSAVSSVYFAQEEADPYECKTLDDLYACRDEVASAAEEVADEYESNEMFERNYDLQERAEILRGAADELSGWEPENDEPTEDSWNPEEFKTFQHEWEAWLEEAQESLKAAIDEMDLP